MRGRSSLCCVDSLARAPSCPASSGWPHGLGPGPGQQLAQGSSAGSSCVVQPSRSGQYAGLQELPGRRPQPLTGCRAAGLLAAEADSRTGGSSLTASLRPLGDVQAAPGACTAWPQRFVAAALGQSSAPCSPGSAHTRRTESPAPGVPSCSLLRRTQARPQVHTAAQGRVGTGASPGAHSSPGESGHRCVPRQCAAHPAAHVTAQRALGRNGAQPWPQVPKRGHCPAPEEPEQRPRGEGPSKTSNGRSRGTEAGQCCWRPGEAADPHGRQDGGVRGSGPHTLALPSAQRVWVT